MAFKYRKRKKTEFHSPEVVRRNPLLQLDPQFRGPSNNGYRGHQATRMRGYYTSGVKSGSCKTYTEDEKQRFAKKRGWSSS